MPSDPFAVVVGSLDPAMAIVTTAVGAERAGCLVGFHCQCSIDPPRYAVWLSKANRTFRIGVFAQHFAVHLLRDDQGDLAARFGTETGDDVDKFAGGDWEPGPDGVPILSGVDRRIVGRKHALLDDGSDHVAVVLDPVDVDGAGAGDAFRPLRLGSVAMLDPGHEARERHGPG